MFLLTSWGFSSVICLFVTFVYYSVRLFSFHCCNLNILGINSLSIICVADTVSCSVAYLLTLCFLCLFFLFLFLNLFYFSLCLSYFKKSFPASKSHRNGLPLFFLAIFKIRFFFIHISNSLKFIFVCVISYMILLFLINKQYAFCTIYQIALLNCHRQVAFLGSLFCSSGLFT